MEIDLIMRYHILVLISIGNRPLIRYLLIFSAIYLLKYTVCLGFQLFIYFYYHMKIIILEGFFFLKFSCFGDYQMAFVWHSPHERSLNSSICICPLKDVINITLMNCQMTSHLWSKKYGHSATAYREPPLDGIEIGKLYT